MGMDVYGQKPTAEVGKYFRNNVWYWRPLAELCQLMAPEVCAKCTHWQTNDGDGLDAEGATALAGILEARIQDGTIETYITQRDAYISSLPPEPCTLCDGTGVRTDKIGKEHGLHEQVIDLPGHPRHGQKGWCNSCNGLGSNPDRLTLYPCDLENVQEFVAFLKACGGFYIN